jgi:hypothetical protein
VSIVKGIGSFYESISLNSLYESIRFIISCVLLPLSDSYSLTEHVTNVIWVMKEKTRQKRRKVIKRFLGYFKEP